MLFHILAILDLRRLCERKGVRVRHPLTGSDQRTLIRIGARVENGAMVWLVCIRLRLL